MRVNEKIRKSVVFVGHEPSGSFIPVGTGFLGCVEYPIKNPGTGKYQQINFLVTADHLVDMIPADEISVRYNLPSPGGVSTIRVNKRYKVSHDDRACDIAMFNVPLHDNTHDQMFINLDRGIHEALHKQVWRAELGDEVSTIGLYSSHYGQTKNIPVVRTGNIAMMPDEPVLTNRGYVTAYLIETKSIVGLSGSPVFLNPPEVAVIDGQVKHLPNKELITLGMTVGYQLVASAEDQIIVPQMQGNDTRPEYSLDERNTGFAVVIPMERIFEIVEHEDFKNQAIRSIEHHLKTSGN
jgi:hypothetical protein